MSAIILFRYHRDFPVCLQTLKVLRVLNPGLPIHGLYGGDDIDGVPPELTAQLDSNWRMPMEDFRYKWMNGDLCARAWVREQGRHLAFDHVYFLEWDMLFLKPLADIYGPLSSGANYTTMMGDYAQMLSIDWHWIVHHYRWETQELLAWLAQNGMVVPLEGLSFGIMGGTVFCRAFLERYAAAAVPSYSNDEVRLSIYSAAYGIPLHDNSLRSDARNIYYANNEEILTADHVHKVAARGGSVLHPIRILIDDIVTV